MIQIMLVENMKTGTEDYNSEKRRKGCNSLFFLLYGKPLIDKFTIPNPCYFAWSGVIHYETNNFAKYYYILHFCGVQPKTALVNYVSSPSHFEIQGSTVDNIGARYTVVILNKDFTTEQRGKPIIIELQYTY